MNNNSTPANHGASRNVYVGSPVKRLEDLRLLPGRGCFVDDIKLKNMLHASILRSTLAHGRLKSIDVEAAKAMPGVHAVITAKDLPEELPRVPLRLMPMPDLEVFAQPVLVRSKVRHVGEALAVVLANTPAQAEDALAAITVDIEPLDAISNRHVALAGGSLLFEDFGFRIEIWRS